MEEPAVLINTEDEKAIYKFENDYIARGNGEDLTSLFIREARQRKFALSPKSKFN